RDDRLPSHLATGVGGAGLFSDGKFSFYPSATHLWQLAPVEGMHAACAWLANELAETGWPIAGLLPPPFPGAVRSDAAPDSAAISNKVYPSFYGSPEMRSALTARLSSGLEIRARRSVERVESNANGFLVESDQDSVCCRRLI